MEPEDQSELLNILKDRFEKNMHRHKEINWSSVQTKLESIPGKLNVVSKMEGTGGEPDVIGYDEKTDTFVFCDCSPESPTGRRSLCYDREALDSRKKHKPSGNAIEMATTMGVEMLSEVQYRELQTLGEFDKKTSSWVKTPGKIRALGGAIFCDRRYGSIFVYHNGADSYYGARGFRALLRV